MIRNRSNDSILKDYAQILSDVRSEYNILTSEKDNPALCPMGDDEVRSPFKNRDEKIRDIIAKQIVRSGKTVDDYLNHSEYVTKDTLNILAALKAEENFFVVAQRIKRRLILNLQHDGKFNQEITDQVSKALLKMYEEYSRTQKISKNRYIKDVDGNMRNKPSQQHAGPKKMRLKFWTGLTKLPDETAVSLNDIIVTLRNIEEELKDPANKKNNKVKKLTDDIKRETVRLARFHHQMSSMGLQVEWQE